MGDNREEAFFCIFDPKKRLIIGIYCHFLKCLSDNREMLTSTHFQTKQRVIIGKRLFSAFLSNEKRKIMKFICFMPK